MLFLPLDCKKKKNCSNSVFFFSVLGTSYFIDTKDVFVGCKFVDIVSNKYPIITAVMFPNIS